LFSLGQLEWKNWGVMGAAAPRQGAQRKDEPAHYLFFSLIIVD